MNQKLKEEFFYNGHYYELIIDFLENRPYFRLIRKPNIIKRPNGYIIRDLTEEATERVYKAMFDGQYRDYDKYCNGDIEKIIEMVRDIKMNWKRNANNLKNNKYKYLKFETSKDVYNFQIEQYNQLDKIEKRLVEIREEIKCKM